ncbi:hypothetical protein ACKKBF_B11935 [Auxenochlorella protothecoides x Auxenochlorella symbiontica]
MQRDAWTDPISASLETLPGGESLPADLGKLLQQLVQASAAEGAGTDSNAADELRDSLSSLGVSIEALQRHNPGSFGSKTLDDVWEMMAPQRLDGDTSDARLSQLLDQAAQLLPELSSLVPSTLPTPASLQMPSHLPPHAGEAPPPNPGEAGGYAHRPSIFAYDPPGGGREAYVQQAYPAPPGSGLGRGPLPGAGMQRHGEYEAEARSPSGFAYARPGGGAGAASASDWAASMSAAASMLRGDGGAGGYLPHQGHPHSRPLTPAHMVAQQQQQGYGAGLPSRAASPSLAGFRYRGVSLGPPGGPGSLTPPAHSLGLEVRPGAHPVNASPFQLSSAPGPRAASPLSRPVSAAGVRLDLDPAAATRAAAAAAARAARKLRRREVEARHAHGDVGPAPAPAGARSCPSPAPGAGAAAAAWSPGPTPPGAGGAAQHAARPGAGAGPAVVVPPAPSGATSTGGGSLAGLRADSGSGGDRQEGARSSKRAIKNRESAARSRARRQEYTQTLEAKVAELQEANRLLREQVLTAAAAAAAGSGHAGAPRESGAANGPAQVGVKRARSL